MHLQAFLKAVCAKEDVVVFKVGQIGGAGHAQDAVEANEGSKELAIAPNAETAYEVGPDNPVAEGEEDAKALAEHLELAQGEEEGQVDEQGVDEDVGVAT